MNKIEIYDCLFLFENCGFNHLILSFFSKLLVIIIMLSNIYIHYVLEMADLLSSISTSLALQFFITILNVVVF